MLRSSTWDCYVNSNTVAMTVVRKMERGHEGALLEAVALLTPFSPPFYGGTLPRQYAFGRSTAYAFLSQASNASMGMAKIAADV